MKKNRVRNVVWTITGILVLMAIAVATTTITDTGMSIDNITTTRLIGDNNVFYLDNVRTLMISNDTGNPQIILKRDGSALDGSGGYLRYEQRAGDGNLYDAVTLNGGFQNTTALNATLDIEIYVNGTPEIIAIAGQHHAITMNADNNWSLGMPSTRWRNVYSKSLSVVDTGTVDGLGVFGSSNTAGMSLHLINSAGTQKIAIASSPGHFVGNSWVGDMIIDSRNHTIIVDPLVVGDGSSQVNITLTSPDGTEWNCGVNDAGTFSCN